MNYLWLGLLLVGLCGGCTPIDAPAPALPATATATTHPTVEKTAVSPTIPTETAVSQRVCTISQTITPDWFDTVDVDRISDIRFTDEDTLMLAGWGPRPKSTPAAPLIPVPTSEPVCGDMIESARKSRFVVQYDLSTALAQPIPPIAMPLNHPCGDAVCRIEVLDESPNGRFQLLHVWGKAEGAWLVDENNVLRLGDLFVPSSADWQWSQDGEMLWYVQHAPGYGLAAESIIVDLADPPIAQPIPIDWEHPLDANAHRLTFSPPDKLAVSVIAPEYAEWEAATRELLVYDFTNSTDKPIAQENVEGLAYATWNEATQSLWLVIIDQNEVILQEWGTNQRLRLLDEVWANADVLLKTHTAIAPAYDKVAIAAGWGNRIALFTCVPESE